MGFRSMWGATTELGRVESAPQDDRGTERAGARHVRYHRLLGSVIVVFVGSNVRCKDASRDDRAAHQPLERVCAPTSVYGAVVLDPRAFVSVHPPEAGRFVRNLITLDQVVAAKDPLGEIEIRGKRVHILAPRAGRVVHIGAAPPTFLRSEDAPYMIGDDNRLAIAFDDVTGRRIVGERLEVEAIGDHPAFVSTVFQRQGPRVLGTVEATFTAGTGVRAFVATKCDLGSPTG